MKKVVKYKCDYCGELFDSEKMYFEHEDRHQRIGKANQMLEDGYTLKEIQSACDIWNKLPEYLEDVTTDNCFKVEYLQCCDKPAYRIVRIDMGGLVDLRGCGSWTGYYGGSFKLDDMHLRNPRPKEELFIDKRYKYGW